jgi:hypothetical protein
MHAFGKTWYIYGVISKWKSAGVHEENKYIHIDNAD